MNVQRCVVVFELRMRGYDVTARPSWGSEDFMRIPENWLGAFEYSPDDIKKCNGNTTPEMIKSTEKFIRSFGEGARVIIWFDWDTEKTGLNYGHALNAFTENGIIRIIDPNNANPNAENVLNCAKLGTVKIMRVDNLNLTNMVKRCAMNRE